MFSVLQHQLEQEEIVRINGKIKGVLHRKLFPITGPSLT